MDMKFKTNTKEENIALQNYLFSQGYCWQDDDDKVFDTDDKFIFVYESSKKFTHDPSETYFNGHANVEHIAEFVTETVVKSITPVKKPEPIVEEKKEPVVVSKFTLAYVFAKARTRIMEDRNNFCCRAIEGAVNDCAASTAEANTLHKKAMKFFTDNFKPKGMGEDDKWFGDCFDGDYKRIPENKQKRADVLAEAERLVLAKGIE